MKTSTGSQHFLAKVWKDQPWDSMTAANFSGIQAARRGTPSERTSENGDQHAPSENSDWKLHVERVRKLELFVKTASLARNKIKPNTRHDQLFHVLRVLRFFVFRIVSAITLPHVPALTFQKRNEKI